MRESLNSKSFHTSKTANWTVKNSRHVDEQDLARIYAGDTASPETFSQSNLMGSEIDAERLVRRWCFIKSK